MAYFLWMLCSGSGGGGGSGSGSGSRSSSSGRLVVVTTFNMPLHQMAGQSAEYHSP